MDKYQKRTDYYIEYEIVKPGIKVYNFLENADYITDKENCVIMTGLIGEQWVINIETLKRLYVVDDYMLSVGCCAYVHPRAVNNIIYAEVAKEITEVTTKYGTKLTAHPGDIIAYTDNNGQPDYTNIKVINKDVFPCTYEKV